MGAAVIPDRGLLNSLTQRLAARLFVRLFNNNVPVLPTSTLADFAPAAFPGYADQEVTGLWSAAAIDVNGRAFSSVSLVFVRGVGGVPETEYGWVLYQDPTPSSTIVAGKTFTFPIVTTSPGQQVDVAITFYTLRG